MNKKVLLRLGIVVFVILLIAYGVRTVRRPVKKTAKLKKHINWETEIEDARIIGNRILFWDGDYLVSLDTEGTVKEQVDRMKENLTPFFTENYCFLYDEEMNKLYQYDGKGSPGFTSEIEGELYAVKEQNGNIILHCKGEEGETLYTLNGRGEPESFFKTDNFILSFDVVDPSNDYMVTELSTSAGGYKSTVYIKDGEMKKYDYPSEVIMAAKKEGQDVYLLTEKTLYRMTDSETLQREVPLATAFLVDDGETYLLHSGILTSYNKDLEEGEKIVLAANLDRLQKDEGYLYGTGKGDIGGQLMTEGEFYTRLGPQMEDTRLSGDHVITRRENELWIYELVNVNEEKGGQ